MLWFLFLFATLFFYLGQAGQAGQPSSQSPLVEIRALDSESYDHLYKLTEKHHPEYFRSLTPGVWIARLETAIKLRTQSKYRFTIDDGSAEQALRTTVNPVEGYTTHVELLALIRSIADNHESIARSMYLGRSSQNREILGLRLSRCPQTGCLEKPSVAYMGPVHGDEVVGRELLIKFIQWIVENDGLNAEATLLLDNVDMYIIPTLNPDGFDALTRENANGIDLNRAFPDRCGVDKKSLGQWTEGSDEPEITAVKSWLLRYQPTGALFFHGGAEVISYPFNAQCNGGEQRHKIEAMPENSLMIEFSREYSQHNQRMTSGAFAPKGTINGASWYNLYGGHEDWTMAFVNRTVFAATAEVSDVKLPAKSEVDRKYWPSNLGSLVRFPIAFVQGIHGRVVDSDTGIPIVGAIIYIQPSSSHPGPITAPPLANGKAVLSGPGGWYHRPLPLGRWEIVVVVPRYIGARVTVEVEKYSHTTKDFSLSKTAPGPEHVPSNVNEDFFYE